MFDWLILFAIVLFKKPIEAHIARTETLEYRKARAEHAAYKASEWGKHGIPERRIAHVWRKRAGRLQHKGMKINGDITIKPSKFRLPTRVAACKKTWTRTGTWQQHGAHLTGGFKIKPIVSVWQRLRNKKYWRAAAPFIVVAIVSIHYSYELLGLALPLVAYNIQGVSRTFTDMDGAGTDYAPGDSLAIASLAGVTGQVTDDLTIGGVGSLSIAANLGGIFKMDPGISLLIQDTFSITVAEGGQLQALGTSGSRCAITGENTTTITHYIRLFGKFYAEYTDISTFYQFYEYNGGTATLINSTITSVDYVGAYNSGTWTLINSTIAQTKAIRYVMQAGVHLIVNAINCAFTTTTANYFMNTDLVGVYSFAGCTFDGNPIAADDFRLTTHDIDIRIYEASAVTETGGLSGVTISPTHPSMDTMGMLYDSTNYMKVPAFFSPPVTVAGAATVYVLQKTAYWPSGLTVASRTWVYWSDSSQAEAGDNQQFTHVLAKSGYVTATDTAWAGAAVSGTLTLVSTGGGKRLVGTDLIYG